MKELIKSKLKQIETEQNVRILLAVESGSRVWGFPSPDSDYDVRFIYVRPEEDYLCQKKLRDVIEYPINDDLDISGWDLKKAMKLLCKSNQALFEWFSSPIIYMETESVDLFRKAIPDFFSVKKGLHHYFSMASKHYRKYLSGETVKAKKYFYALRPVLACYWIIEWGTPPPILFSKLTEAELPEYLYSDIQRLLDIKMNAPEIKEIPKIELLDDYLQDSITKIKKMIPEAEDHTGDPEKLNELYNHIVSKEFC